MGKMVTHAITYKGIVYGTSYVSCSEDEHHPEKLGDEIEWDLSNIEIVEVVDGEIVDAWEEDPEQDTD
jgi:hypothetical protein